MFDNYWWSGVLFDQFFLSCNGGVSMSLSLLWTNGSFRSVRIMLSIVTFYLNFFVMYHLLLNLFLYIFYDIIINWVFFNVIAMLIILYFYFLKFSCAKMILLVCNQILYLDMYLTLLWLIDKKKGCSENTIVTW